MALRKKLSTYLWQHGMVALVLCSLVTGTLVTTGCGKITTPETVAIIEAVGTGAINVVQIVATIQGQPIPQATVDQINKDTALAVAAFTDWSNQKTTTGLQKFQAAMQVLSDYLGPILQAARVFDPALVTAAGLILSELQSVISIIVAAMPQTPSALHAAMRTAAKHAQAGQLLDSHEFKRQLSHSLTKFGPQYAVK
jgi:hypothetical protein